MFDDSNLIYYIGIGIVLLTVILFFIFRKKKELIVDDLLISNILSIISLENIKEITSEISRVKIEVFDLEIIDFDELKSISNGVFISGNNVKVMFKDSADEIVKAIENKRRTK
ncbi:LPXTG cell wall anchor domain-containing protein [Mycoplasmatota bacterium zrk1]